MDVWFAAKPGELALGVIAMALLGGGDGFGLRHGAVEDGLGLAVADGIEGFDGAESGYEGTGFFDEAGGEHGCCAFVETSVEDGAGGGLRPMRRRRKPVSGFWLAAWAVESD